MFLALTTDWPVYAGLLLLTLGVALLVWIASLLIRLLTEGTGKASDHPELARLQGIENHLAAMRQSQDSGLDLRRVEHLLVDLRDGQNRLRETLAAYSQRVSQPGSEDGAAWPLVERITARLLAMGYQRIEWLGAALAEGESEAAGLGAPIDWAGLERDGGELLVEARRGGTLYKGRIAIQGGAIGEVHLRPAHSIFP